MDEDTGSEWWHDLLQISGFGCGRAPLSPRFSTPVWFSTMLSLRRGPFTIWKTSYAVGKSVRLPGPEAETWRIPLLISYTQRNADEWFCSPSLPILESLVWIFLFTMNICMRSKIYVWLQEKLCHVTSGFVIWANNSVQSIMYCFGNSHSTEGMLKSFNRKASHCQKKTVGELRYSNSKTLLCSYLYRRSSI